ncbi:hypothetical protein AV530_018288 [Patagioenas fasciata monilis]|uniref:Uncharacterized protein n=1 Tax=Patagioenas fasciata monilis TaxID=372326 RepID=A0A1V4JRC2_PATFA|nr:hypothetical protein AV530_018288 [Patagioenas fasciata monilis]
MEKSGLDSVLQTTYPTAPGGDRGEPEREKETRRFSSVVSNLELDYRAGIPHTWRSQRMLEVARDVGETDLEIGDVPGLRNSGDHLAFLQQDQKRHSVYQLRASPWLGEDAGPGEQRCPWCHTSPCCCAH